MDNMRALSLWLYTHAATGSLQGLSFRRVHVGMVSKQNSPRNAPISCCFSSASDEHRSSTPDTELIVVRHGETDWNRELRVQGVTDMALNAKGRLQADASARVLFQYQSTSLETPPRSVMYSSQMSRASDTAEAIARSLSSLSLSDTIKHEEIEPDAVLPISIEVSKHEALNEWNLGVLEGLCKEEASEAHPDDWKIFSQWANPLVPAHYTQQPVVGGESMEEVRTRVVDFLDNVVLKVDDDVTAGKNSPVICVTHGGALGQLLRHVVVAQYPEDKQEEIRRSVDEAESKLQYPRPQNACITRFSIDPDTRHWRILLWADTSHLVGDAAPINPSYGGGGRTL